MIIDEIRADLYANQDIEYRDFQSKLTPNLEVDYFIGVRTPILRKMAKGYAKREDVGEFLNALPHQYFDENQIHAFIISELKDYDKCIEQIEKFLPYVNNWATCDQMGPKVFKKNREKLIEKLCQWIKSDETYRVRFAIVTLMSQYLDEDFKEEYLKLVASVQSDEYYINMAIAWYFATALAKQYDSAVKYIEAKSFDKWVQNKTIQKAIESFRVTDEHKTYLRSLKK